MRFILLLLTAITVASCGKKEENAKEQQIEEVVVNPNTFKVEVEGIFKKDDELILFWKDASIPYFDDNHTIYQGIKGSDSPQKIVFEFLEGEMPNDIRLDISSKKEQTEILLNSIKLEQQDRSFVITKDKLLEYFRTNEFITLDSISGKVITKEINGNYDPILFTTPNIYPKMESILMTQF